MEATSAETLGGKVASVTEDNSATPASNAEAANPAVQLRGKPMDRPRPPSVILYPATDYSTQSPLEAEPAQPRLSPRCAEVHCPSQNTSGLMLQAQGTRNTVHVYGDCL